MDIFQIVIIGIIATVLIIILKQYNPEYQVFLSIVAGVIILLFVYSYIGPILDSIKLLSNKIDIDNKYFEIILKVITIAYITEFGSQICKDAGENSIAMKIELAGKVMIVYFAVPIMFALIDFIINLLP